MCLKLKVDYETYLLYWDFSFITFQKSEIVEFVFDGRIAW